MKARLLIIFVCVFSVIFSAKAALPALALAPAAIEVISVGTAGIVRTALVEAAANSAVFMSRADQILTAIKAAIPYAVRIINATTNVPTIIQLSIAENDFSPSDPIYQETMYTGPAYNPDGDYADHVSGKPYDLTTANWTCPAGYQFSGADGYAYCMPLFENGEQANKDGKCVIHPGETNPAADADCEGNPLRGAKSGTKYQIPFQHPTTGQRQMLEYSEVNGLRDIALHTQIDDVSLQSLDVKFNWNPDTWQWNIAETSSVQTAGVIDANPATMTGSITAGSTSTNTGTGANAITFPNDYARQNTLGAIESWLKETKAVSDPVTPEWTDPFSNSSLSLLKGWAVPAHTSECPRPSFNAFSKTFVVESHCQLVESNQAVLANLFRAFFSILALVVILRS